jgi:hypothetical protein
MSTPDLNYLCTREGQVVGPFTREQLVQMKQSGEILKFFWIWEAGSPQWMPANPPPPPPSSPISPGPMEAKTAELNPDIDDKTIGGTSTVVMPSQPARQYARFDSRSEFSSTQSRSTTHSRDVTSEYIAPPGAFGFDDDEETDKDIPIPDRPKPSRKRAQKVEESTQELKRITVVAHDKRHVINGSLRQPSPGGVLFVGPAPRARMGGPFVKGSRIWVNVLDVESGKSENVEAQVISGMRRGSYWEYKLKWDKIPELLLAA